MGAGSISVEVVMNESRERRRKPSTVEERNQERDQRSHDDYQRRRKRMERSTELHERIEWEGPRDQSEPDEAQGDEGSQ